MATQLSHAPLSLLNFGCSPAFAQVFQDRMRGQDVDATCLAIQNTPEGDAEVIRAVSARNWSCWMAGPGLMQDQAWFGRLQQIVRSINPRVPLLNYHGPGDAENAILRQLGVRLPLATA